MSITALARPEIVAMKPYSSARKEATANGVLLNANESPWALLADEPGINRYPEPQPHELLDALARLYDLPANNLLVTRGSDEGIDLLTRVFCRAGVDAILHCPPTFGMYRIAAQTQGADVVSVPRKAAENWAMNMDALLEVLSDDSRIRLVFLTSPNNPTGDSVDETTLRTVLEASRNRAIVVVDEAYAEFCSQPSAKYLMAEYPHLVVLRTLSKAWASAGLRCGAVLAQPELIDLLKRIIAPYPLASPVAALALRTLQPDLQARQEGMLSELQHNKAALLMMLNEQPFIFDCWPGEANFVLLRVRDAAGLLEHCSRHGVTLRGYASDPELANCIRISVGSQQDLAALQQALNSYQESAA